MKNKPKIHSDNNLSERRYDIIVGAQNCDLREVKNALAEDPNSIFDRDPHTHETALHIAARNGMYSIVKRLLAEPHIDCKLLDARGMDTLEAAFQRGHSGIMTLIGNAYYSESARAARRDKTLAPTP